MSGLLLRDIDVLLRGASWVREEVMGGDEPYKSCRVCGKRITVVTRLWRKRCRLCGHRTCPDHLAPSGECHLCVREGPPGSVQALSSRLEAKLAQLKRLHEQGLLTDEAYERGQAGLIERYTDDS
jgi:hypothetical protein